MRLKDTAIINGIPPEPKETSISSTEAKSLGVCVEQGANSFDENNGSDGSSNSLWQIIDKDLEEQSAVTIWRVLGRSSLEHARNDTVTMVELKPKTGRFHQLRRHMVRFIVVTKLILMLLDIQLLLYTFRHGFASVQYSDTNPMMEQVQQSYYVSKECSCARIK